MNPLTAHRLLQASQAWAIPTPRTSQAGSEGLARLLSSMNLDGSSPLGGLLSPGQTALVMLGVEGRRFDGALLRTLCDLAFEAVGAMGEVMVAGRGLRPLADWPAEYARKGLWLSLVEMAPGLRGPNRIAVSLGAAGLSRLSRADGEGTVCCEYPIEEPLLAADAVIAVSPGSPLECLAGVDMASASERGMPEVVDRCRIMLYARRRGVLRDAAPRPVLSLTNRADYWLGALNPLAAEIAIARCSRVQNKALKAGFGLGCFRLAEFQPAQVEVTGWPCGEAARCA